MGAPESRPGELGPIAVSRVHSLQPAGCESDIEFRRQVPGDFSHHGIRNDDLGVQITEQFEAPDLRKVDQRRRVADWGQDGSDASSASSSSGVVWIVAM